MSYYNVLAIFNELELAEVESVITLTQLGLMDEGETNRLVKAVEDYNYLIKNLYCASKLDQQVILFLLSESSTTPEGIEDFITELGIWLKITPSQTVQTIYAHVINEYRKKVYCFDTEEILALRGNLLKALREIEKVTAEKKAKGKYTRWQSQDLTGTEAPMQYQPGYEEYDLQMKKYGSSFESPDSLFNRVPNLKEKFNQEQPSYERAFESYFMSK